MHNLYHVPDLSPSHKRMLSLVALGSSVLEIGSGAGHMTKVLVDEMKCRVTAVEISAEAAQEVALVASVVTGDIETEDVWQQIKGQYDVILLAGVLEHLRRPATVLRRCRGSLSPDGRVIISVPNVAYWSVRLSLLAGRFDYTERGILDRNHLRFFTRRNIQETINDAGLHIEFIEPVFRYRRLAPVCRIFGSLFVYQYITVASNV